MVNKINTVMVIDDNDIDQLLYQRIIKRSGTIDRVISFSYADEALEYLKQKDCEKIDVIFLDINMPRMDGFEFLNAATEQLGESFVQSVVVMLTTSLTIEDRERSRKYSIVKAYINKPLTEAIILAIANNNFDQIKDNLFLNQKSSTG